MAVKSKSEDLVIVHTSEAGHWTTLHSALCKKFEVHWGDKGGAIWKKDSDNPGWLKLKLRRGTRTSYPKPERLGDGSRLGIKVKARASTMTASLSARIETENRDAKGKGYTEKFHYTVISGDDCEW